MLLQNSVLLALDLRFTVQQYSAGLTAYLDRHRFIMQTGVAQARLFLLRFEHRQGTMRLILLSARFTVLVGV